MRKTKKEKKIILTGLMNSKSKIASVQSYILGLPLFYFQDIYAMISF